jgi:predicted short-subunit dehydrogenase-like oxidoreductase (DUF2520 family)
MKEYKISFAGAGKVASALCLELYKKGHRIQQIVSKEGNTARLLAEKCNARWSVDLDFPDSTEIILVAVQDHNLNDVLAKIKCKRSTIIAHTAGSFGLEVFPEGRINTGVLYPLQTFSPERQTTFKGVPVFIESSDDHTKRVLENITGSLGAEAHFTDTIQRKFLHLAAVFVSNFTNYMFTAGKEVTLKTGIPFEVLKPLILETVEKALESGPENAQTGPAVRRDANTIEKHMELLSFSPELKNIYSEITRSIIYHYKKI